MTAYYLDQYLGTGAPDDAFTPGLAYGPTGEDVWSAIDLRPDPTRANGACLVVVPTRVDGPGRLYLGDDPYATLDPATRTAIGLKLGVDLVSATLADSAVELLVEHGREDGTRWRPVKSGRGEPYLDVHLGGLLKRVPLIRGGSRFDENWNCSDSTTSPSCQLTWANVLGTLGILSNHLYSAADGPNYARAESDVATADHEVQATTVAIDATGSFTDYYGGGPCCRFSSSAQTCYLYRVEGRDVWIHKIFKCVAGTETALTSSLSSTNAAFGHTLKVKASGSTITATLDGTDIGNVTDTSITTGTRGGMMTKAQNDIGDSSRSRWDDWFAQDLIAPLDEDYGMKVRVTEADTLVSVW